MTGLPTSRRTVLAGLCATPLVLAAGSLAVLGKPRDTLVLFDGNIARARHAADRAAALGLRIAETRGEIATLLLQGLPRLPVTIIGITGYSELVLARDILRTRGRTIQDALQFGEHENWHASVPQGAPAHGAIAALMRPDRTTPPARATGFAWLA